MVVLSGRQPIPERVATIRLVDPGRKKILVIKLLRDHYRLGLTGEPKISLTQAGKGTEVQFPALPRDQAEHLKKELEIVGATAEVESSRSGR